MLKRCELTPYVMTAYVTIMAVLAATACESEQVLELQERQARQPIVNGTRDPQTVSLSAGERLAIGWLHDAGAPFNNFCTGTLISPNVVVTASHCTQGQRARNIGFGVGLTPSDHDATFVVAEIHEHPYVDAALLELEVDVTTVVPGLIPIAANREALVPAEVSAEGPRVSAVGREQHVAVVVVDGRLLVEQVGPRIAPCPARAVFEVGQRDPGAHLA